MKDTSTRSDLVRLGVLTGLIVLAMVSLKIYDQKTDQIGKFGSQIYNRIFNVK